MIAIFLVGLINTLAIPIATNFFTPIWATFTITIIPALSILILVGAKNLDMDLEMDDAMDTASKLEVLENTIVEASQMLGQYAPIDMRYTNDIEDLTECGCDAVCSCETDSYIEALDDEEVNRENGFFNTRIELEKKEAKKETKRSDVIELE